MKDLVRFFASLSLVFIITVCSKETGSTEPVSFLKTGTDLLIENHLDLLSNKRIAVVTNHTALLRNGTHLVDTLLSFNNINLKKVFSPEHGFKGTHSAGELVEEKTKRKFDLVSLYGKKKKPTKDDLENIDLVIFDIQDIGVRFYTYISTLYYVIEACAENNKQLIVLDRPNPISILKFSGPITHPEFYSFISIAPIPIIHQMTIAELANLFNNEFLEKKASLSIIKMQNWNRDKLWTDYKQNWVKPSPNIPDYETSLLYPMTCFMEGLNISEGRGTHSPFKIIGAPFINPEELASELKKINLSGINFDIIEFTPIKIPEMSKYPKYENEKCYGVQFSISDHTIYNPLLNAEKLLKTLTKLYGSKLKYRTKHIDLLWGNDTLRKNLQLEKPLSELKKLLRSDDNFTRIRNKYLIY